jgi:tRNA-intron endonuclease
MEGHDHPEGVRVGGDARQRFHDARGYGRPLEGNEVLLSAVEAAHLLFRGDLATVDGRGFEAFFEAAARRRDRFALRFLVYADLRERGFYLSPARADWPGPTGPDDRPGGVPAEAVDFVVYERGSGPPEGDVAYHVRVADALEPLSAAVLPGLVVAVVDEESELTYFEADAFDPGAGGGTGYDHPGGIPATLLDDRVVCWDAPPDLYRHGFYGQPLTGRDTVLEGALQLSLVEAAALVARGTLVLESAGYDEVVERGRAVEGDRFDRRLRAYTELREAGRVPKTGFKFGADFRVYADVEDVEDLGHSETLVRVAPREYTVSPRGLSLDVRLAGGVRKRMVFALTDASRGTDWLSVARLTP